MPGKISESIEYFQTLSGQTVEFRKYVVCVMENNILRKKYEKEILPPLADGRIPEKIEDIRECSGCLGLYHFENVLTCENCGRYYCRNCKGKITKSDDEETKEIAVCKSCEDESKFSFKRIFKKIWELD